MKRNVFIAVCILAAWSAGTAYAANVDASAGCSGNFSFAPGATLPVGTFVWAAANYNAHAIGSQFQSTNITADLDTSAGGVAVCPPFPQAGPSTHASTANGTGGVVHLEIKDTGTVISGGTLQEQHRGNIYMASYTSDAAASITTNEGNDVDDPPQAHEDRWYQVAQGPGEPGPQGEGSAQAIGSVLGPDEIS